MARIFRSLSIVVVLKIFSIIAVNTASTKKSSTRLLMASNKEGKNGSFKELDGPSFGELTDGPEGPVQKLKAQNASLAELTDGPNESLAELTDGSNESLAELTDGLNESLGELTDGSKKGGPVKKLKGPNASLAELTDGPNESLAELTDELNESLGELTDGSKKGGPVKKLKGPNISLAELTDGPNESLAELTDELNESLVELTDGSKKGGPVKKLKGPNASLAELTDGPNESLAELTDELNESLVELIDGQNKSLAELTDGPNESLAELTDGPNESLAELTDGRNVSLAELQDELYENLAELTDGPNESLAELTEGRNESLGELTDGPKDKSPTQGLNGESAESATDTKDDNLLETETDGTGKKQYVQLDAYVNQTVVAKFINKANAQEETESQEDQYQDDEHNANNENEKLISHSKLDIHKEMDYSNGVFTDIDHHNHNRNDEDQQEEERYLEELKRGNLAESYGTNPHYYQSASYPDLSRRFAQQYPYTEGEGINLVNDDVTPTNLEPKLASPDLVLAVAKESAMLEATRSRNPSEYLIENNSLRSGNYWNAILKEEVNPKVLRSNSRKPLGVISAKINPGSNLYDLVTKLKQISPRLLYVINKKIKY